MCLSKLEYIILSDYEPTLENFSERSTVIWNVLLHVFPFHFWIFGEIISETYTRKSKILALQVKQFHSLLYPKWKTATNSIKINYCDIHNGIFRDLFCAWPYFSKWTIHEFLLNFPYSNVTLLLNSLIQVSSNSPYLNGGKKSSALWSGDLIGQCTSNSLTCKYIVKVSCIM